MFLDINCYPAKEEKQIIVNCLKEQQRDLGVLSKYANEEQQAKIKALGFEIVDSKKNINTVASDAFELILKAKDNQLTNDAWYKAYVAGLPKEE